jgi:hypothetical protein
MNGKLHRTIGKIRSQGAIISGHICPWDNHVI